MRPTAIRNTDQSGQYLLAMVWVVTRTIYNNLFKKIQDMKVFFHNRTNAMHLAISNSLHLRTEKKQPNLYKLIGTKKERINFPFPEFMNRIHSTIWPHSESWELLSVINMFTFQEVALLYANELGKESAPKRTI